MSSGQGAQHQRIAELYDRQAPGFDLGSWPVERAILGRLRRRILADASGEVLEIGLGTGASLPYYPPDCTVTGIDLSARMLQRAERRARRLGLTLHAHQGDAQHLTFAARSFDTCVSQLSLCTVPDPVAALAELRRVCRSDGRVLLLEHTTSLNAVLAKVCLYLGPRLTATAECHPNRPMLQLVEQSGLEVVRFERHLAGIFVLVWARP
ncbi:MAG: class I SAM-dependent methyltransferase [Chloroflexota bacterium]|nr:class I SAM-dependent methyltransferase [Chloroflexota bacterium]